MDALPKFRRRNYRTTGEARLGPDIGTRRPGSGTPPRPSTCRRCSRLPTLDTAPPPRMRRARGRHRAGGRPWRCEQRHRRPQLGGEPYRRRRPAPADTRPCRRCSCSPTTVPARPPSSWNPPMPLRRRARGAGAMQSSLAGPAPGSAGPRLAGSGLQSPGTLP